MSINPYLFFDGRCEEAIHFYRDALGAEVEAMMRFKDSPATEACTSALPENGEKIMHATLRIGNTQLMASDGECKGQAKFSGFSLALSVTDEAQAEKLFRALEEGGQVQMPLAETFFSPKFGMVADRFGVNWMIMVTPSGEE
ncbi:MAG: VOC family protein [Phycisphaerae bacterium]